VDMDDIQTNPDIWFYIYLPGQLTPEIINRETTVLRFEDIECPGNLSCPICLESFQDSQMVTMINECKHIFNSDQLTTWFQDKTTCPVCRCDLQRIDEIRNDRGNVSANTNIFETMGRLNSHL
jgi:hypothetical protein